MLKKIKFVLPILLIGLLMGPFSSYLFISILHFPVVVPELFFIPFFFIYYAKFGIKLKYKPVFNVVIYLWLLFLLIALLWDTWSFMAVFSTGRSFLILGLFYIIGKCVKCNDSLFRLLLLLSIGSIVGWVIRSYMNFITLSLTSGFEESVVYGNMIAIAFAFSISLLIKSNYITIFLVFALNVFLSFTTALRRQIMVSLMSLGLSLSLLTVKYNKISYLLVLLLLFIPVYLALPQIESTIADVSPNMHKRIFVRSQNLLEGNLGNSEQGRAEKQYKIFTEFDKLIIPHGYVSQQTSKDANTGIFNDVPIYMLSYTFGVIIILIYLILFFRKLLRALRYFLGTGNAYYGVIFVVGSIVLFLHLVDSQMFTVSYSAPFTGLIIGLLFRSDYLENESKYSL